MMQFSFQCRVAILGEEKHDNKCLFSSSATFPRYYKSFMETVHWKKNKQTFSQFFFAKNLNEEITIHKRNENI